MHRYYAVYIRIESEMIFIKMLNYIRFYFQLLLYKMIYGKKIIIGTASTWRKGMSVMIADQGQIMIGARCFFNNYCSINSLNKIEIGEGTIFGENVKIYDHNHRFSKNDEDIKKQGYSIGEVKIGKHCWIGSNVVLLKGSDIGDNCVIGAGCVVNGKIEPNSIVKANQNFIIEKISVGGK